MKNLIGLICLLCGFAAQAQPAMDSLLLERLAPNSENPLHSISVHLENTETGKIYSKAFGKNSDGTNVSTTDAFKIASSTKTFVATMILQLQDEEKLQLDDAVGKYLKIDSLLLYKGKDFTQEITIQQLLNHRSGLADIFTDELDAFFGILFQNPQKQYSSTAIIDLFYTLGLQHKAHFAPDEDWFYSDMNYVLLGLLIEQIDGQPLAACLRKRILEPLQMQNTYFEFYEKPKQNQKRIAQFVTAYDFNEINTSFDWAGGGLVSTHSDLAIFMKALFSEQLVSQKSLDLMLEVSATNENSLPYGLGLYETTYNGSKFYGHYGFYGTYMGYSPASKCLISYCFAQTDLTFHTDAVVNPLLAYFQR